MKRLLTLIIATCVAVSASAWGPKGHDIVAYVAEKNLSKKTLKKVTEILDGKSME